MRLMFDVMGPAEGDIEAHITALAELQQRGLIRHIGLSNATARQVRQARSIAYVPFFPLGGYSPLQSAILSEVAAQLGATPMQTALAWLLQRSQNSLLIPDTSSLAHLRQKPAAAELILPPEAVHKLNGIVTSA
ncbi:putative oxidoreductase YdbC [Duganella sp. HH101]|nr:putative oxidoreductase YdbC [Duganella sp. HH101]